MYEVPASFFQKVEADYLAYLAKWQDKTFYEVLPYVAEISHMVKLHRGLYAPGYPFHMESVDYFNQFAHPLDIILAHREEYYFDDSKEELRLIFRRAYEEDYAKKCGFPLDAKSPQSDWYTIFSGREQTITPYATHGVPGFNPVTGGWETIDPTAIYYLRVDKYDVDPHSKSGLNTFCTLLCDRNLRAIARQKGLILEQQEEKIMANRTIITGRLVADPELRQTQSGVAVTKFRIALQRRFSKEEKADFFDVEAWRAAAEFVCKYFTKGKLIEIDGHLETSPWEDKNGSKHQGVKIIAEQVNFVGDKPKDQSSGASPKAAADTSAPVIPQGFDPFAAVSDDGDLPF